jgi:hypothetical protein
MWIDWHTVAVQAALAVAPLLWVQPWKWPWRLMVPCPVCGQRFRAGRQWFDHRDGHDAQRAK